MPSANMRTVLQMVYLMGILVGTYQVERALLVQL